MSREFELTRALNYLRLLELLLLILFSASVNVTPAKAQNPPPGKVVVTESNRKELDSLLLRKTIPPATEDKAATQAVLKQINSDFTELQFLNKKILSVVRLVPDATGSTDTRPHEGIDYRQVAEIMGEIRSRANRLKSNLLLPRAEETSKTRPNLQISSAEDFKSGLLELDRLIESFTTNSLFQKAVIDVDLSVKAGNDLAAIIELSADLRKVARKLKQD